MQDAELKWVPLKSAFLLAITSAKRVGELYVLEISLLCICWGPDHKKWLYVWIFLPRICINLWICRFTLQHSMKASWQILLVLSKCPIYCLDQKLAVQFLDQLLICHKGKTWKEGFFPYSKQRLVDVIIMPFDALQVILTGMMKKNFNHICNCSFLNTG